MGCKMNYLFFSFLLLLALYFIGTYFIAKGKEVRHDNRVLSVDVGNICKGFAIIMVLWSHIGNRFGIRWLTPLGAWGVGIFLFFSGYGLEYSTKKNGIRDYWKKRITTAYVPYITAEIIGFLFCLSAEYQNLSLGKIMMDIFLIDTVHPFGWYMQCLFIYYGAFFLAKKLFPDSYKACCGFLLIVSFIIFICFRELFKQQLFSFTLGVLIANNMTWLQEKTSSVRWPVAFLLAGLVCLMARQFQCVRELHWIAYNLIHALQVAFLVFGTILMVQCICNICNAVFTDAFLRLGLIAYELYLYHAFILCYINKFELSYYWITFYFIVSVLTAFIINKYKNAVMKKERSGIN